MPKPVRLALVLLAIAGVHGVASEASARSRGHGHGRSHGRRAKMEAVSTRAPRAGGGALVVKKGEPPPKKPVEKAESIGSPNEGRMEGGVRLDLSRPYVRVVPSYESGDVRWGLPTMIGMIDRAARTVAKRFPGSVLDVGDISKKGGGDLLRHHSHESGRDADLGFYAVDAKGKQIHSRGFIKFEGPSVSPTNPGAHFDAPRNWTLIQEMLTDPAVRVSHIFIAEPLRQHLLAYARAHGVPRAIVDHAAIVMMQPTTSLPHDDHLHVRISCPPSMHGSCVELAKNAPHGRKIAHRGQAPLRTPGKVHAPQAHKPAAIDPKKPRPPAAAGVAPQDPFVLDPPEAIDAEGEADTTEVKDLVDESGSVKITD